MLEFVIPCLLGLESLVGDEIKKLGLSDVRVENGRVLCRGEARDIARLNINLRCGARVMMVLGQFPARSFEELFQGVRAIPWEDYLPRDAAFPVKGYAISSQLHAVSACQSIIKKAMVERMKAAYGLEQFPETGVKYQVRFSIFKDEAAICLDTSGEGLYKRGYRAVGVEAPLRETLAAALIMLTPWKKDRILVDPFCGSGTFPIEAAMMAANIAPGMNRSFTAESWANLIDKKLWYEAIDEANDLIDDQIETDIQGYDIDGDVVRMARQNAENAGVDHLIHFQERPVSALSHPKKYGFIITNPPYGERLEEKEALPGLYREFGESFRKLDSWSAYMITSYEDAERYFGRKADKNRKIYNGMIRTYYYQFLGPRPPKKNRS